MRSQYAHACLLTIEGFPVSMIAPDCKIFVDADVSASELIGLVAQFMFADAAPPCEADIIQNDDYDSNRRKQFPGGFVYFRYVIDVYCDDAPLPDRVDLIARVLEQLWDWGYAAVAACAYEDQLPQGGGYKSVYVPWPV